jgi:hypothetical protein
MEVLNNQFLRFFDNIYLKESIKKETFDYFNSYFEYFQNFKNIPFNFDDKLNSSYDFYPTNFKVLKLNESSVEGFSTRKIMNSFISNKINKHDFLEILIPIINKINNVPNNIEDIIFTNLTQKLITTDDFFNNYLLKLHQFNIPSQQCNFNLVSSSSNNFHESYNNINLIHILTLYFSLYKIFINFYNIQKSVMEYFSSLPTPIITKNVVKNEFEDFIFNSNSSFDKDEYLSLSNFILLNIFNIINVSDNIQLSVKNYILDSQLQTLNNSFNTYLTNNYSDNLLNIFSSTTIQTYKNILFYYIFNQFNSEDINNYISNDFNTELDLLLSNTKINQLIGNINQYKFMDYIMPIYNYASTPVKFINIINYFIEKFITDELFTDNIFENIFNKNIVKSNINDVYKKLDRFEDLSTFFTNLDIKQISKDNELSGIMSFYFYKDIIIKFVNSKEFDNWLITFLKNINDYLYSNKFINYNYNWFNNINLIKSYFKIFFLKYISYYKNNKFNNYMYPSLQNHIDLFFDDNDTDGFINFNATTSNIETIITSLNNNTLVSNSIYILTKNIFKGYLNKQLTNNILKYYLNKPSG